LARNDVDPHASAISRREAPEVCLEFCPLQTEGVGNAGRTVHPQSRVQGWKVERTRVVTVAPESPGIPARNGLTAYAVLSPATGLFCHRRPRSLARTWRQRRGVRTTRLCRPQGQRSRLQRRLASTASRPTSVTIAKRPS